MVRAEMRHGAKRLGLACAALALVVAALGSAAFANTSALDFTSSSSQYVTFGQAADLGQATFTLECWIRRDGAGTTASSGSGGVTAVPVICKGRGEGDGSTIDCNYFFGIQSGTNRLAADFEDLATGLNHPVVGTTVVTSGVWHHVAATYDGATWRLYLDGFLDGTAAANATPRHDSIQHASIASALNSTGAASGYFDGVIDEIRIWNHARTAAEILDNRDAEITSGAGLVGRYGLDENGGSTAVNSAVGGTNGSLMNAPAWVAGFPPPVTETPAAPTGLAFDELTHVGVELTWTDSDDLETGFEILRSLTGVGGDYVLLGSVSANTTAYLDTDVDPASEYCYRVRAVNQAGASPESDPACAATLDPVNLSLDFANNSYVTFGNTPTLGLAQFTLELWFKREGAGATTSSGSGGVTVVPLISKGRGESDGSNVDCNYIFGIQTGTNLLAADFEDLATGLNHPVVGTTAVTSGEWHHAAVTYDGTTWRLYLDGNLDGTAVANATPRYDSIQHAGLGTAMTSNGTAAGFFDGRQDEVRIWNLARSQAEIGAAINIEISGPATGLVACWDLDEGTGTVVGSTAGTTVNGTLTGNGFTWRPGAPFDLPMLIPAAPTALVAVGTTFASIELAWTDNADNETSFEVERSTAGAGGSFVPVASVTANTTVFVDNDVAPPAEYCYRVRAVNPIGASDYAAVACATPPPTGGFALDFSGTDYATFGPAPDLGLATFTLECWFRRDAPGLAASSGSGGVSVVPLISKGRGESDGSNVDCNYVFGIQNGTNLLAADFEDLATGLNHPVVGITPIEYGRWYHAAVAYDGTTWALYLDGTLEHELAANATPRFDSIQHAGLGTALNSTGTPEGAFAGALDEVRVWNHARSAVEIQTTINSEFASPAAGLVARYGFEEGPGATIASTAGTPIDGTLVGAGLIWSQGAPFDFAVEIPTAPTNLVANGAAGSRIALNWTDNAVGEIGFEIARSLDEGANYAVVDSAAANATGWNDVDVVSGQLYCYRVRAFNVAGASAWSGSDCATLQDEAAHGLDLAGGTYVTFGPTPTLGLDEFTLELWFKREGVGATAATGSGGFSGIPLLTKGRGEYDGANVDCNYFLGIRTGDNVLGADFEDLATGLNHPAFGHTPIENDRWYHAAATYDGTTWRLYLNGYLEAEVTAGATPRLDSIQHAALGTALNSTGVAEGYFDGVIDEARVWSHARSLAEIRAGINAEATADAAGLVARWGLNTGAGTVVYDNGSAGADGAILGDGYAWVAPGAPFDAVINDAPHAPLVVAPADGQQGLPTAVDLQVQVSDPEGDAMTVTYYGRPVTTSAVPDFTLIGLPDTQYYSETYHDLFYAQTQWVVDNQQALNIPFVAHFGDIVQNGDNNGNPAEWIVADAAMDRLETILPPDGLPFGMAVGNHDQSPIYDPDGTTTFYNAYFGIDRFQGRIYYGGHYGSNNDNHYELFSMGGLDFVVLFFEQDQTPDQPVLQWGHDVLTTHADRRAIVVTHWLIGLGNPAAFSAQGSAIYEALKDCPNLFLMLGGHVHGVGRRQDVFQGRTVHSLLADYQEDPNGGNAWLRLLEFSPANNQIRVKTYSPYLNQWRTDDGNQFNLTYDLGASPWQEIGTVGGAASGTTASLRWEGLAEHVDYEWYVQVSDGISSVTGPVSRFTTGDDLTAVELPAVTRLLAPYPNPFNPRTTVSFDLAVAGPVQVRIYGVDGRLVRTLVDEHVAAGRHEMIWTGDDDRGRATASGVYLLRMTAAGVTQSTRMTLVR